MEHNLHKYWRAHISISCVREVLLQHKTVKALESQCLRHSFGRVGGGGKVCGFPSYF